MSIFFGNVRSYGISGARKKALTDRATFIENGIRKARSSELPVFSFR